MNKLIFIAVITLLLGACAEPIRFEQPQPANKKDLATIPKKLRGKYQSRSDNAYLTITANNVVEQVTFQTKTIIDSLDIEIDSTYITNRTPNSFQLTHKNQRFDFNFFSKDSVLVNYSYQDTIFSISPQQLLRRFKGHYFLNYAHKTGWSVRCMTFKKGELSFSEISTKEDIDKLKEVTATEMIGTDSTQSTNYILKPDRQELKRLLKQHFAITKRYLKIK